MNSFAQLEISTAGFQIESSHIYSGLKSIIFVIDLLGDYIEALTELCNTIIKVRRKGFSPNFDIFLHKADGLSASEQKGMVRIHFFTQFNDHVLVRCFRGIK
jgi:hypothetical protein